MALYDGQKYAPPVANDLTTSQGEAVARFLDEASRRGMKTYMQLAPSHLPKLRDGLDESERIADMPRMPDGELPGLRMVNFAAIASPDVQEYFAAQVTDVLRAYPQIDGLLLDRMEQSFYTFEDAFVDFGPHAKRAASGSSFDFEAIRSAAQTVFDGFRTLTNADLDAGPDARDVPYPVAALRGDGQTLPDALAFRAEVAAGYLARLRDAGNGVGDGVELVPITFPPPMSLLTGVDFKKYSQHADSVMIKFFTMHWPMIVTYWAQAITSMNPGLDAGRVARAVSTLFDMEDEASGDIDHYVYPGPDDAHPAGTAAQSRKIRQATGEAGGMPIPPSVHAYGPIDDVERRWRIGWDAGEHGMWINRYGYLSQKKLDLLKRVVA